MIRRRGFNSRGRQGLNACTVPVAGMSTDALRIASHASERHEADAGREDPRGVMRVRFAAPD